jgi:hypothetical protein
VLDPRAGRRLRVLRATAGAGLSHLLCSPSRFQAPSSLVLVEPASLVSAPVFNFWWSVSCSAHRVCPLVSFEILGSKSLVTFLSCACDAAGLGSLEALFSRELCQGLCVILILSYLFCCELLQVEVGSFLSYQIKKLEFLWF